jgi:hypothetical protein
VDAKLVGEFTGIRWRNDLDLKVNCLWLEHYGYDEGDPTKQYWKDSQSVWFDVVVVARRYIGPMKRRFAGAPDGGVNDSGSTGKSHQRPSARLAEGSRATSAHH